MSANIRNLQAKKAAAVQSARAIVAGAGDRDLNAEEQTQYDTLSATIQALGARIEREQALAVEEAGMTAGSFVEVGHAGSSVIKPFLPDGCPGTTAASTPAQR